MLLKVEYLLVLFGNKFSCILDEIETTTIAIIFIGYFENNMSIISFFALAGAMLLLAIIPGPGVYAVVARALASGFKHSVIVILGIVMGDLIFLLSAIYGLAAVAENAHGVNTQTT